MTSLPAFDGQDSAGLWQRFCHLLWYDDALGLWLDISRMGVGVGGVCPPPPPQDNAFLGVAGQGQGGLAHP
ncbi:MAG: glucose-6-phosphate isomerase, partial [Cyanobacteriota bacterium]